MTNRPYLKTDVPRCPDVLSPPPNFFILEAGTQPRFIYQHTDRARLARYNGQSVEKPDIFPLRHFGHGHRRKFPSQTSRPSHVPHGRLSSVCECGHSPGHITPVIPLLDMWNETAGRTVNETGDWQLWSSDLRDSRRSSRQWWQRRADSWNSPWTSSTTWCCIVACLHAQCTRALKSLTAPHRSVTKGINTAN